jgi:cytochrome P460
MKTAKYVSAFILLCATASWAVQEKKLAPIPYTADGGVPLPQYDKWVFMGAGAFDAQETSPAPRFSNVFVDPAAYDMFVRTGRWPDRTIIVSEKRAGVTTQPLTKGAGWGQTGAPLGFEFEIKDQARGGWRYYSAARGERVGKLIPNQSDCTTCHAEHGAVDNTFVQFYPKLSDLLTRRGTASGATR